jgi:uridine phosphorylase
MTDQPDRFSLNPHLGSPAGRFFMTAADRVGVSFLGIGAPGVAGQIENLVELGCRRFIAVGTAGGLRATARPGEVVLITSAIRDEGVSHHYLPPGRVALPAAGLTAAFGAEMRRRGVTFSEGRSWTVETGYRTTAPEIRRYAAEGVLTTEMEAAAMFAVSESLGAEAAQAVVLDGYYDGERMQTDFRPVGDRLTDLLEAALATAAAL